VAASSASKNNKVEPQKIILLSALKVGLLAAFNVIKTNLLNFLVAATSTCKNMHSCTTKDYTPSCFEGWFDVFDVIIKLVLFVF